MNMIRLKELLIEIEGLPKRLSTQRDLQKFPDTQLYLCTNKEVAARHKLNIPYECGCRQWVGSGVVKIDFYSNNDQYGRTYQVADYVSIKELTPVDGKTWKFEESPW